MIMNEIYDVGVVREYEGVLQLIFCGREADE